MKLNITVFLLKEGKTKKDAISAESRPAHTTFAIGDVQADFYWKQVTSPPRWLKLFEEEANVSSLKLKSGSVQGLLVLEVHERVFCITFGHSRHFIDSLSIERYFGLKTALSLSDPELIKSIDKANIDKAPLRSKSQSSKYLSISEFEFKFDWEILKSLTGVVEDGEGEDDYEVVSGSDSVSLYTSVNLDEIPLLLERLWAAYLDDGYKKKYPWIDYIVPVRDKLDIHMLDNMAVELINNARFDDVWISAPEVVDYQKFAGFCYDRHKKRECSYSLNPDLDLAACLTNKKLSGKIDLQKLHSTKIFLFAADDQLLDTWSLYNCLNCEVEHEGNVYLLSDGSWYQVKKDFCKQINDYFDAFPRSSVVLPNYAGKHEGDYLKDVAKAPNFHLMDQKFIKPDPDGSVIEFCDLLTDHHDLIHVKKYSSSSVLSHLFSQAYVSAECLLRSEEVLQQVNQILASEGAYRFAFNARKQPRENKIILAIMQNRSGALHMPFFSKVNFKQYSQKLIDMGYHVELKKIDR